MHMQCCMQPALEHLGVGDTAEGERHLRAIVNRVQRVLPHPAQATQVVTQVDNDRTSQGPSLVDAGVLEHVLGTGKRMGNGP